MAVAARAGADNRPRGEGILLFGGSGFLGSHILRQCPAIVSVGRTPPPTSNRHVQVDSLANLDVLADLSFDRVILVVGHSDREAMERDRIPRNEPTAFDYHTVPVIQALEQLQHFPVRKFVHFSTVLLYDERRLRLPVSEHAPIDPYKTRYTFSKYLAEEACTFYRPRVPTLNVRLTNMYGPWPRPRFDVIDGLVRQLLDHGRARVRNTRPARDFIYVEDAAEAIVKLTDTDYTGTVNLGTGTATSIGEVVEVLREVSGCPITDLGEATPGPPCFACDMTTVHKLIDWRPRYTAAQGVAHTYRVMRAWRVT